MFFIYIQHHSTQVHVVYLITLVVSFCFFFFQAEDGIRDLIVTGVQTCALPIYSTRGGVSLATRFSIDSAGVAPSAAASARTSRFRAYTAILCPRPRRRFTMLPPMRPNPTNPSSTRPPPPLSLPLAGAATACPARAPSPRAAGRRRRTNA